MSNKLCKGGCGQRATYRNWCKVKWISGNKFGVGCPKIEKKRSESISAYRLTESLLGKNPMQIPEICRRNHSLERNRKASQSLKILGERGLLPQQIEPLKLKEKRKKRISKSLASLWLEGRHPRQLETFVKRRERLNKMAITLRKLGSEGKLPVQNLSLQQKKKIGKKISKKLIDGIRSGRIKLSPGWKRIDYGEYRLRSYWEKVVAKFLDKYSFEWRYETLKLDYFDTERKITAVTIPDFYLPRQNMIIEVKSNAEYKSQKTKDKTRAIVESGYRFILAGRKEIDTIKNNEKEFLNRLVI